MEEIKDDILEKLIPNCTGYLIIYSTSPAHSRWACVHKTASEDVIVMNPWIKKDEAVLKQRSCFSTYTFQAPLRPSQGTLCKNENSSCRQPKLSTHSYFSILVNC